MLQVEELIPDLPSLTIFDKFAVKTCGFYCRASCKRGRGFPSVVLKQWRSCMAEPSGGFFLPPNENSTQFVEVSIQKIKVCLTKSLVHN